MCALEYDQACMPNGADIAHAYAGPCLEPEVLCFVACPMMIDEVCGTDGKTYANPCALEAAVTCGNTAAGTEIDHYGAC